MGCTSSTESVPSPTFRGTSYRRSSTAASSATLPRISSRTKVKDENAEAQLLIEKLRAKRIAELSEKRTSGAVDDATFRQLYKIESKRKFIFVSEEACEMPAEKEEVEPTATKAASSDPAVADDTSASLGVSPSPPPRVEGPPQSLRRLNASGAAAEIDGGATANDVDANDGLTLAMETSDPLTVVPSSSSSSHDLSAINQPRSSSCLKTTLSFEQAQRSGLSDKDAKKHVHFATSNRSERRRRPRSPSSGRVSPVDFQMLPDDEEAP